MKEQYTRTRHVIRFGLATDTYPSIAKAKRASRQLQLTEDGALGRGILKVIK